MLLKIAQNNFPSRQRIVISSLVLQLAEAHNHAIVSMTLHRNGIKISDYKCQKSVLKINGRVIKYMNRGGGSRLGFF